MFDNDQLAERIKRAIILSGLSKKKVAERVGVSPTTITQWCAGETHPSLESFTKLCLVIKANPSELLYGAARSSEDYEILNTIYKFRPSVRKALINFLKLV